MSQPASPDELRRAALFVQTELIGTIDAISDASFPFVEGDLRRFPRESEDAQAATEGFMRLRDSFEGIVAQLQAGAVAMELARERDLPLPPELFTPLQPYIGLGGRQVSDSEERGGDDNDEEGEGSGE